MANAVIEGRQGEQLTVDEKLSQPMKPTRSNPLNNWLISVKIAKT
jgi:hypothetical protein